MGPTALGGCGALQSAVVGRLLKWSGTGKQMIAGRLGNRIKRCTRPRNVSGTGNASDLHRLGIEGTGVANSLSGVRAQVVAGGGCQAKGEEAAVAKIHDQQSSMGKRADGSSSLCSRRRFPR